VVTSNQLNELLDELIDLWISSQISTQNFLALCSTGKCADAEKSGLYVFICDKVISVNLLLNHQQSLCDLIQRRPRFANYCSMLEKNREYKLSQVKSLARERIISQELKIQRERDIERKQQFERDQQLERDQQFELARQLRNRQQLERDRQLLLRQAIKAEQQLERDRQLLLRQKIEVEQKLESDRQLLLRQRIEDEKQRQRVRLQASLDTDFVQACKAIPNHAPYILLSAEDFKKIKTEYVRDWALRELEQELDDEQAFAITHVNGTCKVTARAGSGKTRILITRTIFLIRHCKVSSNSILLLAFNKKAVEEIRSRLKDSLGDEIPHVKTFHSLAFGIVQPLEKMMSDDPSTENRALSQTVQNLLNTELHKSTFLDKIRNLMLEYFRTDWNAITEKSFGIKEKAKLDLQRSMRSETLKNDFVQSYGEKLIANTLFEHGIAYEYEKARRWKNGTYRPDFQIKLESGGGVAIEYFGLAGNADYDKESQDKREYWKCEPGWTLVERFRQDVAGDNPKFVPDLICELEELGLQPKKLSENEIWQLVKEQAINKFTEVTVTFISNCRKRGLDDESLQSLINDHKHESKTEIEFLKMARSIFKSYLAYLEVNKCEDFDGLLGRASDLVSKNRTYFRNKNGEGDLRQINHVMVDEFQDFSLLFYELIQQIRAINSDTTLFCVGDDWQAINGFAGSDLKYFNKFAEYFIDSATTQVSTNYRSARAIISLGNSIMKDYGLPAKPSRDEAGRILVAYLDEFSSEGFEKFDHKDDKITPLLLRIIHKYISQNKEVVILFRTNRIPYRQNSNFKDGLRTDTLPGYRKYLCKCLQVPESAKLVVSTSHRYKGLESDVVIIADALVDKYPIIHATEQLLRIFGNDVTKIFEENRRLFYVAATRAKETLVIVTERERPSPFLENNNSFTLLEEIKDWSEFPTPSSKATDVYLVTVYKAFPVKANLIKLGYKFDGISKCWSLQISSKDWSEDSFKKQVWISDVGKIEVKAQNGDLIYVKN